MSLSPPELLAEHHELEAFHCGQPSLDEWLKQRARANLASGGSRVFVSCEGRSVAAYYSLSASSVRHDQVPGKIRRNMPNPVPVVLLGRLAIDTAWQRKGVGRSLFKDAVRRVSNAAEAIGVRGIVVHPISEEAQQFYLALGFSECPGEPLMMAVTLADVRAILG